MVKQQPVNVNLQTLLCIIPYGWIYAFYRVEKLRHGLVLILISIACSVAIQMVLPWPYGLIGALVASIVIPIRSIRKLSNAWNKKFTKS